MSEFRRLRHLLCGALLLAASAAHAQYVWIDEKGLRQYSDRPPPPSTPLNKILKSPHPLAALVDDQAAASASASATAAAPAVKGPPTLADRETEFRKRQKEQQDAQQKQAQEAAQKKSVCEAALRNKVILEAGTRIREYDAKGERSYMSDEDRAKKLADANQTIAANGCR